MTEIKKRCSGCRVWKPATADYFHRRSVSADGFNGTCKSCRNESSRAYRKTPTGHAIVTKHNKRRDKRHNLFYDLLGAVSLLVHDLEAAKRPDRAYWLAKNALKKAREAGIA